MKLSKTSILYAFAFMILTGCSGKTGNSIKTEESSLSEAIKEVPVHRNGSIMLIVKAKTELSEEEFLRIAREREPQFEAIPGLIQKYYIKTNNEGEYGGVYIWDSMESLSNYRESELAATIARAYKTIEPPSTEVVDILFELRE